MTIFHLIKGYSCATFPQGNRELAKVAVVALSATLIVFGCTYDFTPEIEDGKATEDLDTGDSDTGDSSSDSAEMDTSEVDTASDEDSFSDTDADIDADVDADTDTDADSEPDAESETTVDTETEPHVDTETNDETETATHDTNPLEEIWLTYFERIGGFTYYSRHELLLGPGDSADPEDGTWTIVADKYDMKNVAADGGWARGFAIDVAGYASGTFRFAFFYSGFFNDDWSIDDICLSSLKSPALPKECLWSERFDGAKAPTLPSGWSTFAGTDNDSESNDWIVREFLAKSSPNQVQMVHSYYQNGKRYLISPPIDLR